MKPFIVAEMSANHNGSFNRARTIVEAAHWAGADAIKVQVWEPDTMCLDRSYTLLHGPWAGRKLFDLYRECFTPWEWLEPLFAFARELGIEPFGAAFDRASVDKLESLGVKRHKTASFELTDIGLIKYAASTRKPLILSTGMATRQEIAAALDASVEAPEVTLLTCTSAYPADASQANLARMHGILSAGGLSDHTPGIGVAVAAAALGAVMIEKHLTWSRDDGGPDAGFSLEPYEFKRLVTECRRAAVAIGHANTFGPGPDEDVTLRRGWWTTSPIKAGQLIAGRVRTARPCLGLPASASIGGRYAVEDLPAFVPITRNNAA